MTKFFFQFKKPIFGAKNVFQKNRVVMHNFIRVSSILEKSREI